MSRRNNPRDTYRSVRACAHRLHRVEPFYTGWRTNQYIPVNIPYTQSWIYTERQVSSGTSCLPAEIHIQWLEYKIGKIYEYKKWSKSTYIKRPCRVTSESDWPWNIIWMNNWFYIIFCGREKKWRYVYPYVRYLSRTCIIHVFVEFRVELNSYWYYDCPFFVYLFSSFLVLSLP
jgi:hypothetical protein